MVAETSYQMLEFYHFATGRGLNLLSSIKSTVPTFLVKKQSDETSRGVYIFFEKTQKNLKSNLVLVVVLVLESKRL